MTTPGIDRLENKDLGREIVPATARLGRQDRLPSAVAARLAGVARDARHRAKGSGQTAEYWVARGMEHATVSVPLDETVALLARLEAAEAALRPFAEPMTELDDIAPDLRADDDMVIGDALFDHQQPTVGHLRAAAAYFSALNRDRAMPAPGALETDDG